MRVSTDLAWQEWRAGDFERALGHFNDALALSRTLHDRSAEGHTINFIGLLHQILGDPATATDHYQQALAIAKETGDRKLLGFVSYHLGWVNFLRHEHATSLRWYEESLAIRRELGDRQGEALTLLGLSRTHASLSQFDRALPLAQDALALAAALGDRRVEADARDQIGTVLTGLHRAEEAIGQHALALQLRRELGSPWSTMISRSGLAYAYYDAGRTREAAAEMTHIIELLEEGRRKLSTRAFRASLQAGAQRHYERAIRYSMELRDFEGALAMSERSRARLTLDSVQDLLMRAAEREPELRAEIEARAGAPLTAEQIRSEVLDGESVLVEYSLGGDKSFAWTVTRDGTKGHELPPRRKIEALAARLHKLVAAGDQRAQQREIEKVIDALSAMLIRPLDLPRGVRRLIIVPDGALFYVPFAALELRGLPLVEQYELTTAPSASTLALLRHAAAHRSHEAPAVVFADPVFRKDDPRVHAVTRAAAEPRLRDLARLPGTRAEAETIARLAKGSRQALGFDASRATLLAEDLGRYRIVHFATHALVNAQQPERSGIVLSLLDRRGKSVDGFLRVADLYDLDVQSELVVLSACSTALGKELRGEGIVGLVSGFMHAGAPRVVASFWDVKDTATLELMKRFYRGLFTEHLPPAAALRSAQRSMRSEARFRSPYFWAAFSLYGLE